MIVMFDKNETKFGSNGLAVIDNDIRGEPVVNELFNGLYSLEFKYSKSGEHLELIDNDMIVKAPTPDGDQPFRIYKVVKQMGYYDVSAYHIFYDLAGNFIEDSNIVDSNGMNAIKHIGTGLQYPTSFEFTSDIAANNSARIVRMNAVQALLDTETDNSFINRWGGEIKRDGDTISMNKVRGTDRGFKVKYRKNLTGFEATFDRTNVVTRIMPYGYNGLMLPEKYVDSPHINDYPIIYIKKFDYNDIKAIDPDADSNDDNAVPLEEAYELLRQAAQREYDDNKVDIPTSNFKITMKELSDTRQYSSFKAIEKLEPWDYVTIDTDVFSIKSRMISYKYNPKTKHYIEVELGNYIPSFSDVTSKTDSQINEIQNNIDQLNNDVLGIATAPNGNHTIWADRAPTADDKGKDGDVWYYQNGDLVEMWVYDGTATPPQWRQKITDLTGQEIEDKVDQAQEDAQKAVDDANTAVSNSNKAVSDAGFATDIASEAKASAADATGKAAEAVSKAEGAIGSANKAQGDATNAISNAQDALDKYNNLEASVETEITNINGELSQKVSQIDYDNLKGTVTSQGTTLTQTVNDLKSKADKTTVDTINKTVQSQETEIAQNSHDIQLKADQTVVDNLNKTVSSNTAAIGVNTNSIKLKADKSTVDSLTGRVSTAEGKLTVQAGQIAQTVSKTELTNTLGSYATQTWTQGQIKTTADNINLSVQKVQSNVDNLSAGGRNYLLNSANLLDSDVAKILDEHNSAISGPFTLNNDILNGSKIVASFEAEYSGNSNGTITFQYMNVGDKGWSNLGGASLKKGKNRYTFKGVSPIITDLTSVNKIRILCINVNDGHLTVTKGMYASGNVDAGWSLAPEDIATSVEFSNLEIKVNGIQGTVANKADQSQVTQLADQITSVVGSSGQQNLVYNSDFRINTDGWQKSGNGTNTGNNLRWSQHSNDSHNGSYALVVDSRNSTDAWVGWTSNKRIKVTPGYAVSLGVWVKALSAGSNIGLEYNFYPDETSGRTTWAQVWAANPSLVGTWQHVTAENIKVPDGQNYMSISFFNRTQAYAAYSQPMVTIASKLGPYSPDNVSQSQITQMKDDINLRVQKGDVINQINISPESILIAGQKVHITGQTTIDNAVIKDAMIANLSASKLTAGTIDAGKINVVNLNASNITTGTITGSNLSINLNNGEILFTKGSIKSTNGKLDINVDDGTFVQTDSVGNGIRFQNGGLYLTIDGWFTGKKPDFGSITYNNTVFTEYAGMKVLGKDAAVFGSNDFDTLSPTLPYSVISGSGMFAIDGVAALASDGYDLLKAGVPYESGLGKPLPYVVVGGKLANTNQLYSAPNWSNKKGSDIYAEAKRISLVTLTESGTTSLVTQSDFSLSNDGKPFARSLAMYNRTYSSGTNMTVTNYGTIGRVTSASKYKLDISNISSITDQAHSFLAVEPKQWFDKTETEGVVQELTEGIKASDDDQGINPYYGFIAEDLHSAGLDRVISYGNDGDIEGIQYDRLTIYHHELIRELYQRVNDLEAKIYLMEANK